MYKTKNAKKTCTDRWTHKLYMHILFFALILLFYLKVLARLQGFTWKPNPLTDPLWNLTFFHGGLGPQASLH